MSYWSERVRYAEKQAGVYDDTDDEDPEKDNHNE